MPSLVGSEMCIRDSPDTVVTDRGSQFIGGCWKELMISLGVTSHATTAYHPQCNGLVERMHRQLKGAIRARLQDTNWVDCLPLVLLGLRSAWREGPDAAPSQMLYGSMLWLPGEFLSSPEIVNTSPNYMSSFVSSFQKLMRSQSSAPSIHHPSSFAPFVPKALKDATMVLVRHDGVKRPLQPPYDGPYPVLEAGEKCFRILRNGLPYTVSIDRIKPCNLPLTPPLSSMIPNRAPPPAHPEDMLPRQPPIHPPAPVRSPPMVSISADGSGAPRPCPRTDQDTPASVSSPDLSSTADFPPLPKPPLYTLSGRQSKPRVRLDL